MHLSLACYFGDTQVPAHKVRFLEQKPAFSWHSGLQFAGSLMQTPFLKDLVSMRNPRSEFTFVNYLKEHERLESFIDNRILYPTRSEYEHYLKWAAHKTSAFVAYETPVEMVEPVLDEAGQMTAFRVVTRGGEAFRCTLLSIGAGLAVTQRPELGPSGSSRRVRISYPADARQCRAVAQSVALLERDKAAAR